MSESTDETPAPLPTDQAAVFCAHLRAALRAIRLNLYYPSWRAISDHLAGVGHLPPDQDNLAICPRTGWPAPNEWLRFRIDHKLAPDLIAHVRRAADAGDEPSAQKAAYLQHLHTLTPMREPDIRVALVNIDEEGETRQGRFEVVMDRWEPGEPSFIRWTVRVLDQDIGDRISVNELEAKATTAFKRRLQILAAQPALAAWLVLWDDPDIRVEELVRGQVGPVQHHASGPRLSATLTRIANHLSGIRVDDPLSPDLLIPETDNRAAVRYGMSHSRKWAVPESTLTKQRTWLNDQGSKNLVYPYTA